MGTLLDEIDEVLNLGTLLDVLQLLLVGEILGENFALQFEVDGEQLRGLVFIDIRIHKEERSRFHLEGLSHLHALAHWVLLISNHDPIYPMHESLAFDASQHLHTLPTRRTIFLHFLHERDMMRILSGGGCLSLSTRRRRLSGECVGELRSEIHIR